MAGIRAPGRKSARDRHRRVAPRVAQGGEAGDQRSVAAAAAILDGLAVPLHGQVHFEIYGRRVGVDGSDRTQHLAVFARASWRCGIGGNGCHLRRRDRCAGRGQADLVRSDFQIGEIRTARRGFRWNRRDQTDCANSACEHEA